ncbi:DUF4359 domain-containing protein [Umezakia ovalisporum]|jgi:hypothetical protein|uniref:DUF4359 domain-containing protein n=2 Tax=Umezakia ovalisporum TaxID=75695 RepID=A0AA43H0C3_9CYAN|nr:DUF4359 domain-containing protein [Umezakia ovalisporum]MBI1242035.1 DUF4359 domain-containing protein [Nostoc sp. RI_552]MDH6056644.1 DUF4359 domain-containing protein [Umezakia ovalisporum FSS-43]MDH6065119.1 DUF4359 domain-containing protein [Umezakia ovalisporum FSS-62]MDH6067308.1 DUF4359 domain-containing protein [Umezakia ovalisporum APH033B]MDH6070174.1 DUF4359 domain-containing protein [Umezakia ovalisporum CobakiLakeA]
MKALTIVAISGAGALAALGVAMAGTNPSQAEYEDYAIQRLTDYLKQDFCRKTTNFLENLIKSQCENLVDEVNPQMREILARTTERQNLFIFSIYKTDLKLSSFIPIYKFETVGALNNFYTYKAEQQ